MAAVQQRAAAPSLSDLAREALTAHEGKVGHAAQALAVELADDPALLGAVVQRALTDAAIFAEPLGALPRLGEALRSLPAGRSVSSAVGESAPVAAVNSHRAMIDAIGCASLALALGLPLQTVAAWKGRDSIPCWRWRAVEEEARKRRLPGITYEAIETAFNHRRRDKAGPRLPTV